MVKKAVLVCGWEDSIPPQTNADYIGIDRGALLLARQKQSMIFAIGDFDSIDAEDDQLIQNYAEEVIRLNPHKDVSDTEAAITETIKRGYDEIMLWGALGGRFDHALVNLKLVSRHPCLSLEDLQNEVYTLTVGGHTILEDPKTYLSIFALENSEVSLEGFKYPLTHATLSLDTTLGLSNQLTQKKARISVHYGKILVVRSKDK